jgi:hypothetical protein
VNKGKLDPCGAVHITIGDGGNREGLASKYVLTPTTFCCEQTFIGPKDFENNVFETSSSLSCLQSNFLHIINRYKNPQPAWSVFREASFGHGELKLANSTHAFWSWHRNDDDEPVRSDQVWITSLVNSECVAEKKHGLRKILMGP